MKSRHLEQNGCQFLIVKGSTCLRRFCRPQVKFRYESSSAGLQGSRNHSRPGASAALRECPVREVQRSSALSTIVRPVSAQAVVHLPTLSGGSQSGHAFEGLSTADFARAFKLIRASAATRRPEPPHLNPPASSGTQMRAVAAPPRPWHPTQPLSSSRAPEPPARTRRTV